LNKTVVTVCRQLLVRFVPRSARVRKIAVSTAPLELSSADARADRVACSGVRVPTPCSNRWHDVLGMPELAASSVIVRPFARRSSASPGFIPLPTNRAVTGRFSVRASLGMKLGWGCSRPCSHAPTRAPSATSNSAATSRKVRPAFRRALRSAAPSTLLFATNGNPTWWTGAGGTSDGRGCVQMSTGRRFGCLHTCRPDLSDLVTRAPPYIAGGSEWR